MKKYSVMLLVAVCGLYASGDHENEDKQPLLMMCAPPVVSAPQYVEPEGPSVARTLKDRAPRLGDGTPLSVDTDCVVMTPKPQDPSIGFTRSYTRPDKEAEKEPSCWEIIAAKMASLCNATERRYFKK